jgi:hypothetical protein
MTLRRFLLTHFTLNFKFLFFFSKEKTKETELRHRAEENSAQNAAKNEVLVKALTGAKKIMADAAKVHELAAKSLRDGEKLCEEMLKEYV